MEEFLFRERSGRSREGHSFGPDSRQILASVYDTLADIYKANGDMQAMDETRMLGETLGN